MDSDGVRSVAMSNVLSAEKREQVVTLGRLGWPLRRIEAATGVRRETASGYLKAAGIAVRPPGGWGRLPAKPAKEATTDPAAGHVELPQAGWSPRASACEPYRELIEVELGRGRNGMAIWQDLVTDHGFAGSYESVKRFARKLRGARSPDASGIIQTGPGEDYVERRVMVSHTEEAVESFDCSPGVAKRVST